MRKLGIALVALLVLSLPAWAVPSAKYYTEEGGTAGPAGPPGRDCSGPIVWDTGMTDDFTPPTGCSSAASAGCFINALNPYGIPPKGRWVADDWISDGSPVTDVKIWARYNASGYNYHIANPGSLHGFCVRFYEALDNPPWCPDGTNPDSLAIGPIAYDAYCQNFVETEITGYLVRNFKACITLDNPFFPVNGHVYWTGVSADFDYYYDGVAPTQWFWRVYPGLGYDPFCEASWWDEWNSPATPWEPVSVAVALPCWAGWDASFVLYDNYVAPPMGACCHPDGSCVVTPEAQCTPPNIWHPEWLTCDPNNCPPPPTPVENSSWGSIKHSFK